MTTSDSGAAELWKTDGSAEGLVRFLTTEPGVPITQLTDVDGKLFFAVTRFSNQDELWTTDGTVASTVELREFQMLAGLTNVNGRLFFANFHVGFELWESDGTGAGTRKDRRQAVPIVRYQWQR